MFSPYRIAKPLLLIFTIFIMVIPSLRGQSCEAKFGATSIPISLEAQFINLSTGNYTTTSWNFGDGWVVSDNAATVTHAYTAAGTYYVCVTISDANSSCNSTYCNSIYVDATSVIDSVCQTTDCVFPGDANADNVVNAYDVLPIALNYATFGTARPNANTSFYGQYAADWQQTTPNGADLKHADCNGDGLIDFQDITAIQQHFSFEHDGFLPKSADGVPLYVVFDPVVYPTNPNDPLVLSAGVYLGTATETIKNINGLAFLLDYDENIVEPNSVNVQFHNQSIIANSNMPLEMAIDDATNGIVAMAYARTDQQNAHGFSKLATVSFTISDVIINFSNSIQVGLNPNAIVAMDSLGNPVSISGIESNILLNTTATDQQFNDPSRIRVFPNPAEQYINIDLDDFKGEQITIHNMYGQKVREEQVEQGIRQKMLSVSQLTTGLYTITIRTEEGVISRQIFIK